MTPLHVTLQARRVERENHVSRASRQRRCPVSETWPSGTELDSCETVEHRSLHSHLRTQLRGTVVGVPGLRGTSKCTSSALGAVQCMVCQQGGMRWMAALPAPLALNRCQRARASGAGAHSQQQHALAQVSRPGCIAAAMEHSLSASTGTRTLAVTDPQPDAHPQAY